MINIDDFNYAWQLEEASKKLEEYVNVFETQQIGLTDGLLMNVCPEAGTELNVCIEREAALAVELFHENCLYQIDVIFSEGKQDLTQLLGKILCFVTQNFRKYFFRRETIS